MQRHQLVADAGGRHVGTRFGESLPFGDRQRDVASVFERASEVDAGRSELGIGQTASPERVDRAGEVAERPQSDRVVEVGEMRQRIVGVEGDPNLVQFGARADRVAARQRLCGLDERAEAELSRLRPLDQRRQGRRSVVNALV